MADELLRVSFGVRPGTSRLVGRTQNPAFGRDENNTPRQQMEEAEQAINRVLERIQARLKSLEDRVTALE